MAPLVEVTHKSQNYQRGGKGYDRYGNNSRPQGQFCGKVGHMDW